MEKFGGLKKLLSPQALEPSISSLGETAAPQDSACIGPAVAKQENLVFARLVQEPLFPYEGC